MSTYVFILDKRITVPKETGKGYGVFHTERSEGEQQILAQLSDLMAETRDQRFVKLHEDLSVELQKQFSTQQSDKVQFALIQTEHKNLEKRHRDKLVEHEKLKKRLSTLQSENEEYAFRLIASENIEGLYKSLLVEHEQLREKCSNMQRETEPCASEKTEHQKLEKLHEDLLFEHNELKKQFYSLQSEKEQLDANCRKLNMKCCACK